MGKPASKDPCYGYGWVCPGRGAPEQIPDTPFLHIAKSHYFCSTMTTFLVHWIAGKSSIWPSASFWKTFLFFNGWSVKRLCAKDGDFLSLSLLKLRLLSFRKVQLIVFLEKKHARKMKDLIGVEHRVGVELRGPEASLHPLSPAWNAELVFVAYSTAAHASSTPKSPLESLLFGMPFHKAS